jgi:hypothetical protein
MPQEVSPLETLAQMGEIRARNQQMQTNALQQQGLQMENQQRQIDLNDSRLMSQAWQQANGDLDQTLQNFMKLGGSPKGAFTLQQKTMELKKQKADLTKSELDANTAKNDQIEGLLQPVLAESDPVKQKALWDSALATAVQKNLLTADEATQHPYQGPDAVKQYATGLQTDKWVTAQAAKDRASAQQQEANVATDKDKRTAAQENRLNAIASLSAVPPANDAEFQQRVRQMDPATATSIFAAIPPGQYDPQKSPAILRRLGMNPEQQTQADQAAANAAQTKAHETVLEQQGAQRNAIEQKRLNLQEQQFGFDTNGGVSSTAKAIVNGDLDPQTVRSMLRRNPGLIEQAKKLDPNFDEATIDNRYNTLKEFNNTSVGKAGGQALALNTLVHHADLYMKTAEALKNGTFRPGNAAYNEVASVFGSAPPTNAALVARFFAGETGKVATGGVPAEGEINGILKNLGTDASPEAIAGAGKTLLQIAAGRATPLMERVKDAKLDNVIHVIGPDAQEILQRRGFDPQTMKPQQGGQAGMPAVPASIPSQYRGTVHYSPSTKLFYFTPDGGKTWQTAKP